MQTRSAVRNQQETPLNYVNRTSDLLAVTWLHMDVTPNFCAGVSRKMTARKCKWGQKVQERHTQAVNFQAFYFTSGRISSVPGRLPNTRAPSVEFRESLGHFSKVVSPYQFYRSGRRCTTSTEWNCSRTSPHTLIYSFHKPVSLTKLLLFFA